MFSKLFRKPANLQYPPSGTNTNALGIWAENLACEWLSDRGLVLLQRNFRCRYGEIDLIMQDGDCLVFIEVRYRKNSVYGSAEDSITKHKCQRLRSATKEYFRIGSFGANSAIRFDAVAISPANESDFHCTINWIKNILQ